MSLRPFQPEPATILLPARILNPGRELRLNWTGANSSGFRRARRFYPRDRSARKRSPRRPRSTAIPGCAPLVFLTSSQPKNPTPRSQECPSYQPPARRGGRNLLLGVFRLCESQRSLRLCVIFLTLASSMRKRKHQPPNPDRHQHKRQERPHRVANAFAEPALGQERERHRHAEREDQHGLKMIQHRSSVRLAIGRHAIPAADFIRFENDQKIQHPGRGENARAVIAGGFRVV